MLWWKRVLLLLPVRRSWSLHSWCKSRCIWSQYSLRWYSRASHPHHLGPYSMRGSSSDNLVACTAELDLMRWINLLRCIYGLLRQGLSTRCCIVPLRRALWRSHRSGNLAAQSHGTSRRSLRGRLLLLLLTFLLFEELFQEKWLFLKFYMIEFKRNLNIFYRSQYLAYLHNQGASVWQKQ